MLFSIVMPCFNVADVVARTLNSVFDQTLSDFELLAVDDGSTDETLRIIRDAASRRLPVSAELRVLRQDNRGPGAARNHGLREARGDLVAFLDADDLWSPDYLATVAQVFQTFPHLDALATNTWDILPEGCRLKVKPKNDAVLFVDNLFESALDGTIVLRTSGVTIRRSVVDRVGYMREDLLRGQDKEYWARLTASRIRWGFLPKPLLLYNALRMESVSRNESRFVTLSSPEVWSRDIWPLVDHSMESGFRGWYLERARTQCWECLKAGLDDQAKATAKEALSRSAGWRDTLFLLSVRYIPGTIHRLVWRLGLEAKKVRQTVRGSSHLSRVPPDLPRYPGI